MEIIILDQEASRFVSDLVVFVVVVVPGCRAERQIHQPAAQRVKFPATVMAA